MARLLEPLPRQRLFAPNVVIGVGMAHCAVKPLIGIPAQTSIKVLTAVVRENASSFFLRCGTRTVISPAQHRADGSYWAAAFDADVVDAIVAALRARRLTRVVVIPSIGLAGAANSTTDVCEDGVSLSISRDEAGRIVNLHRRATTPPVGDQGAFEESTSKVDPGSQTALMATRVGRASDFIWRPEPDRARRELADRTRLFVAGVTTVVAAALAILAPGLHAAHLVARSTTIRATVAERELGSMEAELRRTGAQLDRIDEFTAGRGAMMPLLRDIARVLPESVAVVTMRVDSLEGSIVVLGKRVTDVLPEISAIAGVVGAHFIGSVTRETEGTAQLERATIRFRRPRAVAQSNHAPARRS
ncbi:MAG: hypothetical protein ABI442_07930 [Gemmatimonadaceae bacterium]